MIWTILIAFTTGLAGALGMAYLAKSWKSPAKPHWLSVLSGEVPWVRVRDRHMRTNANETGQNSHEVYYVPRQEIAECGVACPKCKMEVAERADFSRVQRCFINGQENEVLKCPGVIPVEGSDELVPCPAWLAASPNTEHGDHLIEGDPPEFYRFNRISLEQAMREKYGVDVGLVESGLHVDASQRPAGAVPSDDVVNKAIEDILSGKAQLALAMSERPSSEPITPFAEAETRKLPVLPPAQPKE